MKENLKLFASCMAAFFSILLFTAILINTSDIYLNLGELPYAKTQIVKLAIDWDDIFRMMFFAAIMYPALLLFQSRQKKNPSQKFKK